MNAIILPLALTDAYTENGAVYTLYRLLKERPPEASITHRQMPTLDEHKRFFDSRPYEAWYLVDAFARTVGAVSLTKQDDIGVFIFKSDQGRGHARPAVEKMMKLHPRSLYRANINPANVRSIALFTRLGFELAETVADPPHLVFTRG